MLSLGTEDITACLDGILLVGVFPSCDLVSYHNCNRRERKLVTNYFSKS